MSSKKSKVTGQILQVENGPKLGIVGGTLADLLNLDNWSEIDNGTVVREQSGPDTIIVHPRRKKVDG